MLGLNGKLLDFIYPVGSYYETSDTSFNPNTAWGGTWVEDTKGRVTVALDSEDTDFDTLGETGGSKYLQAHYHKYLRHHFWAGERTDHTDILGDSTVAKGKGMLAESSGVADIPTGNSGNLQPYIVVKRWHRTA